MRSGFRRRLFVPRSSRPNLKSSMYFFEFLLRESVPGCQDQFVVERKYVRRELDTAATSLQKAIARLHVGFAH